VVLWVRTGRLDGAIRSGAQRRLRGGRGRAVEASSVIGERSHVAVDAMGGRARRASPRCSLQLHGHPDDGAGMR